MTNALYYLTVALLGMVVLTPLTMLAWQSRRVWAMVNQPVQGGWELSSFRDLDRQRLRMYRLHSTRSGPHRAYLIRDDEGKRIGRIDHLLYEPASIEMSGRTFTAFDQGTGRRGPVWRGKVGGRTTNSVVLRSDGKAVAELLRKRSWLRSRWQGLQLGAEAATITAPPRPLKRLVRYLSKGRDLAELGRTVEVLRDKRTVARIVRPDPTGAAPIIYVALPSSVRPEFAASVLYLATLKR
jgi:hypothetical protein